MTDTTNTEAAPAKKPSHIAYNVCEINGKAEWKPIGRAWANADGRGFNIQLDDGMRITLRVPKKK